MQELSEIWYHGYHRRSVTSSLSLYKTVVAIVVLILCGVLMVVVGVTNNSSHMKTGGYTMCCFGLIAGLCFIGIRYLKKTASNLENTTEGNESPLTRSVEHIELLLLREGQMGNSEAQTRGLSSSRRELNFLLTRIFGYPPSYEEVTTNDTYDTRTQVQCDPPPCYTDDEMLADVSSSPPSYETIVSRTVTSEV